MRQVKEHWNTIALILMLLLALLLPVINVLIQRRDAGAAIFVPITTSQVWFSFEAQANTADWIKLLIFLFGFGITGLLAVTALFGTIRWIAITEKPPWSDSAE